MIKHVVSFRLQEFAVGASKQENAIKIKSALESLPDKIKEIKSYECGINIIESERSSDLVWITSFNSIEDLNTYINHPEHQLVADFVMKVRSESRVVDFESD